VKENNETLFSLTENRETKISRIKEGVEKKKGCRIEGTLNLPKVFKCCFLDTRNTVI
jgi:hypothetical protein